jgi:phosphatidylinositol alpha-1,6-mannosyltransferase
MAAMFAARDGARAAYRFLAAVAVTALALIALLAPAVLFKRGAATALVQNSVLFPLGLTRYKTPAESLLPGHLLASMGTAGHVVSVGLLLAAGLAVAVSLVIRPPRDVPAAVWRLAIGLTVMFLLGPNVRFGYFIYPFGLIGWLVLTQLDDPSRGRRVRTARRRRPVAAAGSAIAARVPGPAGSGARRAARSSR